MYRYQRKRKRWKTNNYVIIHEKNVLNQKQIIFMNIETHILENFDLCQVYRYCLFYFPYSISDGKYRNVLLIIVIIIILVI